MSTLPENLTPTRRWTKPLLVAVPTLLVLIFVYTSCQFTEPNLSFIPKGAKVKRSYSDALTGVPASSPNPLVEVTEYTWLMLNPQDLKSLEQEVRAQGFKQSKGLHVDHYRHANHDSLFLQVEGPPVMLAELQEVKMIRLTFLHEEARPVHQKIKRFILWVKTRK